MFNFGMVIRGRKMLIVHDDYKQELISTVRPVGTVTMDNIHVNFMVFIGGEKRLRNESIQGILDITTNDYPVSHFQTVAAVVGGTLMVVTTNRVYTFYADGEYDFEWRGVDPYLYWIGGNPVKQGELLKYRRRYELNAAPADSLLGTYFELVHVFPSI